MNTEEFWNIAKELTMPIFADNIKHFSNKFTDIGGWEMVKQNKLPKDGVYLTLRYGPSGLYTAINEFKNGQWQMNMRDGSYTALYRDFTDEEMKYLTIKH